MKIKLLSLLLCINFFSIQCAEEKKNKYSDNDIYLSVKKAIEDNDGTDNLHKLQDKNLFVLPGSYFDYFMIQKKDSIKNPNEFITILAFEHFTSFKKGRKIILDENLNIKSYSTFTEEQDLTDYEKWFSCGPLENTEFIILNNKN